MRDVAVVGVGMTRFGKFLEKGIKDLVREAVEEAVDDAGIEKKGIEAAYMGNAVAGLMTGQEMIRGQVTLSAMGIEEIPIFNVESACASSSSAFHLGWTAVAAGLYDCVLVAGFEKLYDKDKRKSFQALGTGVDVEMFRAFLEQMEANQRSGEKIIREGSGEKRSVFMDMYAFYTKRYMERYGLTQEHFAKISVKAHKNGAFNPHAQYQKEVSLEEVLQSGDVAYPLTRMMCAPIGDGAAAAVLCAKPRAARYTTTPIWVAASVAGSGMTRAEPDNTLTRRLAPKAYETAGVGPEDVEVIEVHDATSPSEIISLIELTICPGEEAAKWIDEGYLDITGRKPTNPSGGLVTKGHPVGATGCGQIYEIVKQLSGEAGKRQVRGPRTGMTHNGGGIIGMDAASMTLHIFKR
ncbi:MAG: thiolase family protein [Candidatus Hydrogenedentota bacterium]|nr:MAG: thiolase family protein [Candidatus Hydrogenedentota bacterium]